MNNKNNFIYKLNYLPVFDPSLWPKRELLSRITAISVILIFVFLKIYQFNSFPGSFKNIENYYLLFNKNYKSQFFSGFDIKLIWSFRIILWTCETSILLGYIFAYIKRSEAIGIAKGFMEVVFPFIIAGMPILISFTKYNLTDRIPLNSGHFIQYYIIATLFMIAGNIINLIGLMTLHKSFSVMSEARIFVNKGIYKFIRHPLYLGHFIMFFGSVFIRLHSYTIAMYVVFVIGQTIRAFIEEKKIIEAFPEYTEYKKTTGMFFPKFKKNFIFLH